MRKIQFNMVYSEDFIPRKNVHLDGVDTGVGFSLEAVMDMKMMSTVESIAEELQSSMLKELESYNLSQEEEKVFRSMFIY